MLLLTPQTCLGICKPQAVWWTWDKHTSEECFRPRTRIGRTYLHTVCTVCMYVRKTTTKGCDKSKQVSAHAMYCCCSSNSKMIGHVLIVSSNCQVHVCSDRTATPCNSPTGIVHDAVGHVSIAHGTGHTLIAPVMQTMGSMASQHHPSDKALTQAWGLQRWSHG